MKTLGDHVHNNKYQMCWISNWYLVNDSLNNVVPLSETNNRLYIVRQGILYLSVQFRTALLLWILYVRICIIYLGFIVTK